MTVMITITLRPHLVLKSIPVNVSFDYMYMYLVTSLLTLAHEIVFYTVD